MRMTLTEEQQAEIIRLLKLEISCAEIARRIGTNPQRVWRFKKMIGAVNEDSVIPPPGLIRDKYDLEKWELLQKNWPPKMPQKPKPKRRPSIRTPYNFDKFKGGE